MSGRPADPTEVDPMRPCPLPWLTRDPALCPGRYPACYPARRTHLRPPRRSTLSGALSLGLLLVVGMTAGCGESGESTTPPDPTPPPPPAPTTIQVTPALDTLAMGESTTLTASVLDQTGTPMTGVTLTWSSSDPALASVSSAGEVNALGEGPVVITARAGEAQGTADLFVLRLLTPVDDEGGTVSTEEGDVTVEIPEGAVSSGISVSIASEDPGSLPPGGVPGAVVRLGPAGQTFSVPVTLRLRYDPGALAPGIDRTRLRIHRLTEGGWIPLEGSSDPDASAVTTQLTSFSVYGIVADPEADLQVTYLLSPASLVPGASLEHAGEIRNLGPDSVFTAVAELRVTGSLGAPTGLPPFCAVDPDREDADLVVRCTVTDLGPGDAAPLLLQTPAGSDGGTVAGILEIVQRDAPPDPDPTNDAAEGSALVVVPTGEADLSLSLAPSAATLAMTEAITAALQVSNAGPGTASDLEVRIRWPEGRLLLASGVEEGCESTPPLGGVAGLRCTLETLGPGESRTLQVPLRATASTGSAALEAALVGWTGVSDANTTNHAATATLTVTAPDTVVVEGQEALEALSGISVLPGDLRIQGEGITNLAPLSSLTTVGGEFRLQDAGITSLAGLENLASVGGNLILSDLPSLTDITALSGLEGDLPAGLFLFDLPLLTSLAGLEGITGTGGTLSLNRLPALADISALSGITRTGGGVSLLDLAIPDLAGLAALQEIEGQLSLFWNTLPQVDHVEFPALERVGGAVGVAILPTGPDIGAGPTLRLPALTEAGGIFLVTGPQGLARSVRTAEFPVLQRVSGSVLVSRASDLETLELGALTEVLTPAGATSGLQFRDLPVLASLTLGPATLTVFNLGCPAQEGGCNAPNASLTSLDGISSGLTVLTFLSIRGHPGFSNEAAQAFVDRIQAEGANVIISDNGSS